MWAGEARSKYVKERKWASQKDRQTEGGRQDQEPAEDRAEGGHATFPHGGAGDSGCRWGWGWPPCG